MTSITIPRLQTERTIMREPLEGDLDAYAEMTSDPETMRFIGGVASREEAWRGMALHLGHWQLRGYGTWMVLRRTDGALLGRVGLWNPEGWPGLEVGWKLVRSAWGQGYATECARAAIAWAWSELEVSRLVSMIDPRNERSIAVARRLGMTPWRDHEHHGTPVVLYALERPAD